MDEAFINPIRQVHLAVGMVRKATVDAAVIYLGGSKGSKEEEKDEATHFQEKKVKRLDTEDSITYDKIVGNCLLR